MEPRARHVEGWPDTPGGADRPEHGDRIGAAMGCLCALLVVGLMGAVLFLLPQVLSFGPREHPPSVDDLDRAARSAPVARAAPAAARRQDADLDFVTTAVRGDPVGPDGYLDRCADGTGSAKLSVPPPEAGAIVCARSTVRALGGRGGPRAGLLALDRAMRSRGWYVSGTDPRTGIRFDPHAAPPAELGYVDRAGDFATVRWGVRAAAAPPGATATATATAGASPDTVPGLPDLEPFLSSGDFTYPGFRSAQPPPPARDIARAAAGHPYVLTVELTDRYWHGGPHDL